MEGRCVRETLDGRDGGASLPEGGAEAGDAGGALPDVLDDRPDTVMDTCVPMEDLPDSDGRDTNCDGIDGDAANAVFVAASASEGGDGSRTRPFRTLSDALRAVTATRRQVLVAGGVLMEALTVPDNVIIAGGYDPATWRVSETQRTRLVASCPVVTARRITNATLLRFDADGRDATDLGASCVAVMLESADGLQWSDSRIRAGRGADGVTGAAGGPMPSSAPAGVSGLPADLTLRVPRRPTGGVGGATCNAGGAGGAALYMGALAERGTDGVIVPLGGRGGEAGVRGAFMGPTDPRAIGSNGADGLDGASGTAGASATPTFCLADAMGYSNSCAAGRDGTSGTPGGGGGGGGGAGLSDCGDGLEPKPGGGGGGGGGGGCGGNAGRGAGGGGASIGVLVVGGTARLERVAIETAGGGRGGNGGAGAAGAGGGGGGSGAGCSELNGLSIVPCRCGASSTLTAARGGNGGRGGTGGRGGGGGGAAGGPSVGIVLVQGARVMGTTPFNVGRAGQGGASGDGVAMRGATGLELDTHNIAR